MKGFVLKTLAVCLVAAVSSFSFAASPANEAPAQSVSGKWSGSFDISEPDGSVKKDTAWLNLKQDGNTLTGTAGPNEGQQSEIKDGTINGRDIQFTVERPGASVKLVFALHLDGGRLTGQANGDMPEGKVKVKVDTIRLSAQPTQTRPEAQELYDEISHMDTVLFDAFNNRDLTKMRTLFTDDLEFYHDRDGLTVYQQNMASFKSNFESTARLRRALMEGSLEVYPIPGYGAVEIGVNDTDTTEKGQQEHLTGTAKFVHVWQKKNGEWKISRVISYDHR